MDMRAVGLGAAAGFVAGAWDKFQEFLRNILALIVRTSEYEEHMAYAALMFIARKAKPIWRQNVMYAGANKYVRPLGKIQLVAFLCPPMNSSVFYKIGKIPVCVTRKWNSVTITFFKASLTEERLALMITDCFNEGMMAKEGGRFFIRHMSGTIGEKRPIITMGGDDKSTSGEDGIKIDRFSGIPLGWKVDDIGEPQRKVALSALELSPEVVDSCDYAKNWLKKRTWFIDRGIPWRLGYAYEGLPGSGKTATVRALGQELDMPIFVFDIATMTNNDLIDNWNDMMSWAPCIALFEDLHTVFNKDERILNTGHEAGVNMGTLLNVLDGVENTDGILSIVSTNNIETLSTALGGSNGDGKPQLRPGRVNKVLTFGRLDTAQQRHMVFRILGDIAPQDVEELLATNKDSTGSQFQDACAIYADKQEQ